MVAPQSERTITGVSIWEVFPWSGKSDGPTKSIGEGIGDVNGAGDRKKYDEAMSFRMLDGKELAANNASLLSWKWF
jgi:hypothetical protein